MDKLYDNGALLLGDINMVIKEVQEEIKKDIDMACVDTDELLKDLLELKDIADIVMVNYENPMGYTIVYWSKNDVIKGV